MAKITTTVANSTFGAGTFVVGDEALASSYTLEQGAFLISTTSYPIDLKGAGAWTVNINGHASGADSTLFLEGGGAASKITVGAEGSLHSIGSYGAIYADRDVAVDNKGVIYSQASIALELYSPGASSLTNSGFIAGQTYSAQFGTNAVGADASGTVTNTGTMLGTVWFDDGASKLSNSGLITNSLSAPEFASYQTTQSNILFGAGADIFDNKGTIDGYINLGGGLNKATNAGTITGADLFGFAIAGGGDGDTIINAKTGSIQYGVSLGDGANNFTNAGFVGNNGFDNSLAGGGQVDTVKNSGTLNGDVSLSGGNDVFTNTGQVSGRIDLGEGDDTFKGGNFAETVFDNAGSDKIGLGGGNDVFVAFGGAGDGKDGLMGNPAPDEVDGGTGIDTYDGSQVVGGTRVNLDSVDHEGIVKGTAGDGGYTYIDKLKGFENVTGGGGNDFIYGSSSANVIMGGGFDDLLFGLAGNDTIDGGGDFDVLTGGLGADILIGGSGGDRFSYDSVKDSGLTKATRDEIMDFVDGLDTIRLFNIDAISGTPTDDVFSATLLLGNGTFTAAGQLRFYQTATGWMVEGEVTGDNKADFSIAVRDLDYSISWDASDFLL